MAIIKNPLMLIAKETSFGNKPQFIVYINATMLLAQQKGSRASNPLKISQVHLYLQDNLWSK